MIQFKSEKDKPFEDWPDVGEILVDRRGDRRLTVIAITPHDKLGRNIVGTLHDGRRYSCDVATLISMWGRSN